MFLLGVGIWALTVAMLIRLSRSGEGCSLGYDPVTDKCLRCSFDYYRDSLDGSTYFPRSECKKRDASQILSNQVWISNYTCAASSPCDGSLQYPFDSLIKAMLAMHRLSNMYLFSTIKFYFLNIEHYVLIMDLSSITYVPYLFYNINCELEFSPWYCDMGVVNGCLKLGEQVKVNLKTNEFLIFFSKKLVMSSIIFDGNDIHIQTAKLASACYNKKSVCCTIDKINNKKDVCFLYKKSYKELAITNFGLLNNDWTPDSVNPDKVPTLSISNSEFRNIYLLCNKLVGFFSLIKLMNTPVNASFLDVNFTNVYFEYGILFQKNFKFFYDLALDIPQNIMSTFLIKNCSFTKYNYYTVNSISDKFIFDLTDFKGLSVFFSNITFTQLGIYNEKTVKTTLFSFLQIGLLKIEIAVFKSMASHYFISTSETDVVLENVTLSLMSLRVMSQFSYFDIFRGNSIIKNVLLQNISFVLRYYDYLVFTLRQANVIIENFEIQFGSYFSLYLENTVLSSKNFIVQGHTCFNSLFTLMNVIFESKNLKFVGFIQNYTDAFSILNDKPPGTILKIEGLYFLKASFVCKSISRILNWPKSQPEDKILIKNFVIDEVNESEVSFLNVPKIIYMDFDNITVILLKADFTFINLYDFEYLKIKDLFIGESKLSNYFLSVICTQCYMVIDGLTISNNSKIYYDLFFLSNSNGYYSKINISQVIVKSSATLFIMQNHKVLLLENITALLYDTSATKGLSPIFYASTTDSLNIQSCIFMTWSSFRISYTTLFNFFQIKQLTMSQIEIGNFTCRDSQGYATVTSIIRFSGSNSGMQENFPMMVNIEKLRLINCSGCASGALYIVGIRKISLVNVSYQNSSTKSQGGFLSINNVYFVEISYLVGSNSSSSRGGALFFNNINSIQMQDSNLFTSRAYDGGFIFFNKVAYCLVKNCSFSNSSSLNEGGVVHASLSFIHFYAGNVANSSSQKSGGAFYFSKCNLSITNQLLARNFSADSGGFLYSVECQNITIRDLNLSECEVFNQGAAFYFLDCSLIQSDGVSLRSNRVQNGVGTVYAEGLVAGIYNFSNTLCSNNTSVQGACFSFVTVNSIIIGNSLLEKNTGRLIDISSPLAFYRASLFLYSVTLIENNLKNTDIMPEYLIYGEKANLNIKGMYLRSNLFNNSLVYFTDCDVKIENINFKELYMEISKGFYPALFEFRTGNVSINSVEFEGTINKEASFLYTHTVNLSLRDSIFKSCQTMDWACLLTELTTSNLMNVTFVNSTGVRCGAIYASKSQLTCKYCFFQGNYPLSSNTGEILSNDISIYDSQPSYIENSVFKTSQGLALLFSNSVQLFIKESKFLGPGKYFSKAVYAISSNLTIVNSIFSYLDSDFGGALLSSNKKKEIVLSLNILNSEFENCKSSNGGAFYFSGFFNNIRILQSSFVGNRAYKNEEILKSGTGAVGLLLCLKCNSVSFELKYNKFRLNYAEWFGATIFSQIPINHQNDESKVTNEFLDNSDGLRISTELLFLPFKLIYGILRTNETELLLSRNTVGKIIESQMFENGAGRASVITSGEKLRYLILVTDSFGNLIFINFDIRLKLQEIPISDVYLVFEQASSKCEYGICLFPSLKINVNQNTLFSFRVRFELSLKELFAYVLEEESIPAMNITLQSRLCRKGEIYIDGDKSCYLCPKNKYSLLDPAITNRKCLDCPENAICVGGDMVTPIEGYWRASGDSTLIIECIAKSSCLGYREEKTTDFVHGDCAEHHSGVLCYTCAKGYARFSSKDTCKLCNRNAFLYLKIIAGIVSVILYIVFQVHLTLKINSSSYAGILLKQLVNHFQQIGLVSLVDLGWTPDIKSYFAIQEYLSFLSEEFITMDCLIDDLDFNLLTKKIVFSNILPILLSLLTLILWIFTFYLNYIIKRRNRSAGYEKMFNQVRVSMMIIVYLLFPEILRKCFSLLNCIVIDDFHKTKVLLYSPQIECWGRQHYTFIFVAAFPGLFCWGFLTPLFILILLSRLRTQIVHNIKSAKKLERMQTSSFEALKIINQIRSNKKLLDLRRKTGAKTLSFVAVMPEVPSKELHQENQLKRNNFFDRKGIQENSDAGVLNEQEFFRMNSLLLASNKLQESTPNIDSLEKDANKKSFIDISPSKQTRSQSFMEKWNSFSMTLGPNFTDKEERIIKKENGMLLKFLYRGYSSKYYFWELVMFSKKFFLIFIASFNDFFPSSTKAIVLLVFMAFYIFIQTKFKPFEKDYLNNIEFTSLVMTFLTANMGIMLFTEDFKKYSGVFLIFILIFNFSFIVLWLIYFFRHVLQQFGIRRFVMGLLRFKYSEKKT